ncbi:MAG: DNA-3-methyladenine glycosylase I [Nitrospinota bacterium]|nr:MAG: DNA-3-methyladenine glycosylase I [Nitrospinota bacterium]
MKRRCAWANSDPLYQRYHDYEWGVPEYDDRKLFELLILEGMQAGLSWLTILKRRDQYRQAFDNFDPRKVSAYDTRKVEELLNNRGIIRNRKKILAAIQNARAFLAVQESFGSFATYIWRFVGGKPLQNAWPSLSAIPAQTPLSVQMSRDLRKRGFAFVGPIICYAFMQATGMVNDHTVDCFRHKEIQALAEE